MSEVEKTLLYISEARQRAERALKELERDSAEPHLVKAMQKSERVLADEHRRLMQATYYATPDGQERFTI